MVGQPGGGRALSMRVVESTVDGPETDIRETRPIGASRLWLRTDHGLRCRDCGAVVQRGRTPLRADGRTAPLVFDWRTGTFQGVQVALSCYNSGAAGGHRDIDRFTLSRFQAGST